MKKGTHQPSHHNGTVYLIHLEVKMGHAQHYIGFAYNVEGRLHHHRNNRAVNF